MKILGVIPARYKSSRFEGKPLCLINGVAMIERTYKRAMRSNLLNDLLIATDSELIQNFCNQQKLPVMMTSETCLTGTDRLAEVAKQKKADLYINIQGDEPIIDHRSINEVIEDFKTHQEKYIAYNLYKFSPKKEAQEESIIKVITNEKDELLYMSRSLIPFSKINQEPKYKKQVCVYGFSYEALQIFSSTSKTQNEKFEDIEILRFLDLGYKVKMKETKFSSISVDIPSDIAKVEAFLKANNLN